MKLLQRRLLSAALLFALACQPRQAPVDSAAADGAVAFSPRGRYVKQEVLIPVRDGIELNTEIYAPSEELGAGPWPILITRTPYGLRHDDDGFHTSLSTSYADLARDGYIFVFQDIRGRYGSSGEFVMLRPPRLVSGEPADEASDTNDSIDWLLENVEGHNGKVGVLGISYGGWLTVMSMLDPHPAIAAVSPQASPADMYLGDDFSHNGAFRLAASFGYVALMETGSENAPFAFDQADVYEWYLDLGPYSNVESVFTEPKPTWELFMKNATYSDAWRAISVLPLLEAVSQVEVPALHVAGWWDAEDFYGPLAIYGGIEERDSAEISSLVVGPWRHGGWARGDGASLGEVTFSSNTAEYYRSQIERRFFAHHLKGEIDSGWDPSEAKVFETGANRWREFDSFPPVEAEKRRLYLQPNRRVGWDQPRGATFAEYVSDPASPVPYMPRPIPGFWQGGQALWKVTDQRFVDRRPDVLSFESERLSEPVTVCGEIIANLVASTTGTDSDWIVKLIDVHPEEIAEDSELEPEMAGFQLMVADEVFRAKFRDSFEQAKPVSPGEPVTYRFSLGARCHTFQPGHAIMVQIQSTWFPLIGRNPQTFVDIPNAKADDYQKATQRVWLGEQNASYLELPVLSPTE